MARQTLNNGESLLVIRTKANDNFSELYNLGPAIKIVGANYTIGTTDLRELLGGIIYVNAPCILTIPAVAVNMFFRVVIIGAIAVSVDPNAADLLIRDGVTQADGEKITSTSTTGDEAIFSYYNATGLYAATNGWTNGG